MVFGCAKDRSYDEVFVEKPDLQILKTEINSICSSADDPCLYVPSVENSPYSISESRPFSLGTSKLVKIKLREDELSVIQIDSN
jgi:hypothetical protein